MSDNSPRRPAGRDETIGELDDAFFANARVRRGGRILREATGTLARRGRPPKAAGERKEAVSLRLSPEVLAHFRATGSGWQTRIDKALRTLIGERKGIGPAGPRDAKPGKARVAAPTQAEIVVHGDDGRIVSMDTGGAKPRLFQSREEAVAAARKAGKGGWVILKDSQTGEFALLGERASRGRGGKKALRA